MNTPEVSVLKDVHPWAPKNMPAHRYAETMALCNPRLKQVIKEKGIELISYNELQEKFLNSAKTRDGGRGILNSTERLLINPLSRFAFDHMHQLRKGRTIHASFNNNTSYGVQRTT